ncbi:MAG TPA: sigma-70 family RNA polymerase sigma factor [Verrucomicrobiales bacterium]|nr:sigma-70 family RNA polymerase sigma factor [Verrucomicrobiales bacterium]
MDRKEEANGDAELVRRAQAGDTKAFDELVLKFTSRLHGLVYNMTANREDTDDLLQDIFAKAYRSLRRFRGHSSFYTWIYTIAVNMTLNFLKKRGRRQTTSLEQLDFEAIDRDVALGGLLSNSDPVRETHIHELQRRLNEAMLRLSEDHRAVVTMFDIQGLPHSEISEILGISQGTVRSRLFYAHRQLQNFLEEFRR